MKTKTHLILQCMLPLVAFDSLTKENPDKFKKLSYKVDEEIRRPEIRLTVDNPEDLIVVRKIWDAIGTQEGVIPLADIIKFLDENPEIKAINSGILAGTAKTWK